MTRSWRGWYDSKTYLFHESMLVSPFTDNIQRRGFDKPLEKHHHSDLKKESGLETFDDQNNKKQGLSNITNKNKKKSRRIQTKRHTNSQSSSSSFNKSNCNSINQNLLPYSTYIPGSLNQHVSIYPDDLPWCCSWCPQGGTVRRWIWSWSLGRSLLPN